MAVSDSDDDSSGDCYKNGIDLLPIKNVSRIVKKALPANTIITEEATETVQECASEFIGFFTCEAWEKCKRERRRMMTGDDILYAMKTLGFDDYVGPLQVYLQRCVSYQRKGKRALEEGEECSTARDKKVATAGYVVNMGNSRGEYDNEGMYGGGMGMTARDMVDDNIDACARWGNVVNMWNSEGGYDNRGRIGMANDEGATTAAAACNGGNIVNKGNGEGEYGNGGMVGGMGMGMVARDKEGGSVAFYGGNIVNMGNGEGDYVNGGMDSGMGMVAREKEGGSVAFFNSGNVVNMGNSEGGYGDGAMDGGMGMVARDKEGGSVACTGGNVVNMGNSESGYGNGAMNGGIEMVARDSWEGDSAACTGGNVVNMGNSEGGYGNGAMDGGMGMVTRDKEGGSVVNMENSEGGYGKEGMSERGSPSSSTSKV